MTDRTYLSSLCLSSRACQVFLQLSSLIHCFLCSQLNPLWERPRQPLLSISWYNIHMETAKILLPKFSWQKVLELGENFMGLFSSYWQLCGICTLHPSSSVVRWYLQMQLAENRGLTMLLLTFGLEEIADWEFKPEAFHLECAASVLKPLFNKISLIIYWQWKLIAAPGGAGPSLVWKGTFIATGMLEQAAAFKAHTIDVYFGFTCVVPLHF